jgi:hypothetical protein
VAISRDDPVVAAVLLIQIVLRRYLEETVAPPGQVISWGWLSTGMLMVSGATVALTVIVWLALRAQLAPRLASAQAASPSLPRRARPQLAPAGGGRRVGA